MKNDSERRHLLDDLQAALETVRAGCESGLRALEALRAADAGEETGNVAPLPGKVDRPAAAPVPARMPSSRWEEILDAAVARLPEEFTKADLVRELGYQPTRGTLLRIIERLLLEKTIEILQGSDGGTPTMYRKVESNLA